MHAASAALPGLLMGPGGSPAWMRVLYGESSCSSAKVGSGVRRPSA